MIRTRVTFGKRDGLLDVALDIDEDVVDLLLGFDENLQR